MFGIFNMDDLAERFVEIGCPVCWAKVRVSEKIMKEDSFTLPCGCFARQKYLTDDIKRRVKSKLVN